MSLPIPDAWVPAEAFSASAPRALVWDAKNTSSLLVGQRFRASGLRVDWLTPAASPWSPFLAGKGCSVDATNDAAIEKILAGHPLDAFSVHGDDQVRWILARWDRLTRLHRFLSDRDALEIALSKPRSQEIARRLGIPVLPTERCSSPAEVARASRSLSRDAVILKGDGSSAGSAIRRVRAGREPSPADWAALTAVSPEVMVQREIRGARVLVTVVYDRGRERAVAAHEKVCAFPAPFGITAAGVSCAPAEPLAYARRFFLTLAWNGFANIELRQDESDGRWYFMEVNPRVPSSVGIQSAAGADLTGTWAALCRGEKPKTQEGYASGVRYVWSVPALALIATRPASVPGWVYRELVRGASDLAGLPPALRSSARRVAVWHARHALGLG